MNLRSLIPIGRDRTVARHELLPPFATLQREIDRLFDDFTRGWPALGGFAKTDLLPSMDVTETDKAIEITAELPGLEEKDVEINVADKRWTSAGKREGQLPEELEIIATTAREPNWRFRTSSRPASGAT